MEDEFHTTFEVFSQTRWKCTVVDVEALKNFVCGECLRHEHSGSMNADFAIDHVVIAGSHNLEDGEGLFSPDLVLARQSQTISRGIVPGPCCRLGARQLFEGSRWFLS